MEDKQYCVYKHVSPNGKIYIGQTKVGVKKRWSNGNGYKRNSHFFNAIEKYGWNNFEHVIIATDLTKKEADYLEKYLISYYETTNPLKGYNLTTGGERDFTLSDSSKQKISEANKGRKRSAEFIEHIRQVNTGRKHTEEELKKISEAHKGKKLSDEHKKKLSEFHKGLHLSEEAKDKVSKFQSEHVKTRLRDEKGHFIKSA